MNITFLSDNSCYEVECPDTLRQQGEAYVNRVEGYVPILKETFGLETLPPFDDLKVRFGDEGPCYEKGGMIKLQATMDLADPKHLYGGLFLETINGLLEGYVWLRDSHRHYLPTAGAIILQVATLDRIHEEEARQWASKFARGSTCPERQRPILLELVRVYRENGFGPIRAIYSEMRQSICPTLHRETLVCDLNRILRNYGVANLIRI